MLNKILRLLRQIVSRGVVSRVKFNNGVEVLQFKATGGDPFEDVEKIENYGFASRPLKGAEVIALSLGGNGSHTIAITVGDRRYRFELAEGDAAIYDYRGNYAWIKSDLMHVKHKSRIRLEAPDVDVVGNLKVTGHTVLESTLHTKGNATFDGSMTNGGKDVGKTHGHIGDDGGSISGVT